MDLQDHSCAIAGGWGKNRQGGKKDIFWPVYLMSNRPIVYTIRFLFISYLLLLLRIVVLRGPLGQMVDTISKHGLQPAKGFASANFIPFKTLYYYLSLQEKLETGTENIGGNIVLFLPFGFLLPLAWRWFSQPLKLILAAFLCSLFLETLQLLFALGNFDVDDLLLNLCGALVGFLLFSRVAPRPSINTR
jgi:glycopeptide antibiotics resistance protein